MAPDWDNPNAGITRPFNIAKFSEFYFVAAEAAVKGATTKAGKSARELINVIRARAGKWKFNRAQNVAKTTDNSAAMVAATPATIDINYILAESSREYYGEGFRWFDLVRTQKWAEIAGTYKIASSHQRRPYGGNCYALPFNQIFICAQSRRASSMACK